MARNWIVWAGVIAVSFLVGCNDSPSTKPAPVAAGLTSTGNSAGSDSGTETSPAGNSTTATTDDSAPSSDTEAASKPASGQASELKLEVITFKVPAGWQRVNPPSVRILDAEFTIPRADGDEFDGRLTLMAAGGGLDASIGRWSSEFTQESGLGPKTETLMLGENEVQWVDIRGTYNGPANRAPGVAAIEPRPDYRMAAVIIPLTPSHAFYIKLTGPKATVAARMDELKDFVRSAKVTLPK
jgi:gluconolactonase